MTYRLFPGPVNWPDSDPQWIGDTTVQRTTGYDSDAGGYTCTVSRLYGSDVFYISPTYPTRSEANADAVRWIHSLETDR